VEIEKVDTHEEVSVKALLDSSATGMFIDTAFVQKHRFKLERLKNTLMVRNVDRTINVGGAITYQVECNVFYRNYVERMRMDVCNLGKTEIILGMPWLVAHNPEINWKMGKVKMIRFLPICGRNLKRKKKEDKR